MTMMRGNGNSICTKTCSRHAKHVHRMRAPGMLRQTKKQALPVQWSHTIYDDRAHLQETWEDYVGNEE